MGKAYDNWLGEVRDALRSANMAVEHWQRIWAFDFEHEYKRGTKPEDAAMKANRYWWHQQNKSLGQDCRKLPGCWLPQGHPTECQPCYEHGDYVKTEFSDKTTGIGEWMWLRVDCCDDERQLIFGTLDNDPIATTGAELGQELVISYSTVREHRKPWEFKKN